MLVVRGFFLSVAVLALGAALIMITAGAAPANAQRACRPNLTASHYSPVVVSFDTGSVKINSEDAAKIKKTAQLAKDNYIQQICVTGFADKQGDAKINQRLSERRAEAVAAALRKHGIASDTLVVSGKGELWGESLSGSSSGSSVERRVEIRFTR
jgi:outer membrane protein OmpA-like peptidoglycan-associated protein